MPVMSYLESLKYRSVPARSESFSEPTLRSTRSRTRAIIFDTNQPMARMTRKPMSFGTNCATFDQASFSPWVKLMARVASGTAMSGTSFGGS